MRAVNVYTVQRFTQLPRNAVFVFGSNLAGRHGKGGAKDAVDYFGAKYGQGIGLQGNSYAIPTKDSHLKVLPLSEIRQYVKEFLIFAKQYPNKVFVITPLGTGLANYTTAQIAPMFEAVPDNCFIPRDWLTYYPDTAGVTSYF